MKRGFGYWFGLFLMGIATFAIVLSLVACGGSAAPVSSSAPSAPLTSSTALPQGDFKVDVFLFGYQDTTIPADGDMSFDAQMTGFSTVGSKFEIVASNGDKFSLETSKTIPENAETRLSINVRNFFGLTLTQGDEPYVLFNNEKFSLLRTDEGSNLGHLVMHFSK